jgi:hypothetical protein
MPTIKDLQSFTIPSKFNSLEEAKAFNDKAKEYLPLLQYSGNSRLRDLINGFQSMLQATETNIAQQLNSYNSVNWTPEQRAEAIAGLRPREEEGTLNMLNEQYIPQMQSRLQKDINGVRNAYSEIQSKIDNIASNRANVAAMLGRVGEKDANGRVWTQADDDATRKRAKEFDDRLLEYAKDMEVLGIKSPLIVQDAGGNWISKLDADTNAKVEAAKVPAAASTPVQSAPSMTINWKSGLSDTQKQGIQTLTQKPVSQWTDTDKKNWAYATNNQALPTTTTSPAGTTIGQTGGSTPPAGATLISGPSGLQGLTESQIWRGPNGQIYKLGSTTEQPKVNPIDALPPEQRAAAQALIDGASQDAALLASMDFSEKGIQEAIARYVPIAAKETDPYYNQLYTRATEDYAYGVKQLKEQRQMQVEQEQLAAQLQQEQAAAQSADSGLATSGIRNKLEERLAKQSENVSKSSRMAFGNQTRTFGRNAEDLLGSARVAGVSDPSVFTPSTGVRGSIEANQTANQRTRAAQLAKEEQLRKLSGLSDFNTADLTQLYG